MIKELEQDAELVLSGLRLMNRPMDNAKERFIEGFIRQRTIDKFPVVDDDLVEEAQVRWSDEDEIKRTIKQTLASEIEAAFAQGGIEPPASSAVIATKILSSDTGSNLGILADLPFTALDVDLILGHVVALGYRWPPRVAIAVARRAMVVLLNRQKFSGSALS